MSFQSSRAVIFAATAAILAVPVLTATPGLANDTTAQLATGSLVFTHSFDIEMAKEDLFISPEEVRVNYVFHNTSDKDVETIVAFPMPDMKSTIEGNVAYGDYEKANWMNFQVSQDGVAIEPQLQQRISVAGVDMTDQLVKYNIPFLPMTEATGKALDALPADVLADWITRGLVFIDTYDQGEGMKDYITPLWTLSEVYWWKAKFPAGADVTVQHTYKPSVGGTVAVTFLDENNEPNGERFEEYKAKYCLDDSLVKTVQKLVKEQTETSPYYAESWISYILTTGGNWNGPIKDFTLTVDKGLKSSFVSFCGTGVKKIGPTTFQMKATDFYPEKDLEILLLNSSQVEAAQ